MRRVPPLLPFLAFYISGVLAWRYLSFSAWNVLIFVSVICFVCAGLFFGLKFRIAAAFPFAALMGFFLSFYSGTGFDNNIQGIIEGGEKAVISGGVIDRGVTGSGNTSLTVDVRGITAGERQISARFRVVAYVSGSSGMAAHGDSVSFAATLVNLDFQRNPGGYDEYLVLRTAKIDYKAFAEDVTVTGKAFVPAAFFPKLRNDLGKRFDKALPAEQADYMKSLVLGDRGELDPETKTIYQKAGVFHILAVSGLHVSIMASIFQVFCARLLGRRMSAAATLGFILFYCFLTGASAPTVRALIMAGIPLLAVILKRESSSANNLCLAALILLLYQPLYLFGAGFQYSFAAVFALSVGGKRVEGLGSAVCARLGVRLPAFVPKAFWSYLASCAAVTAFSLPITLHWFYGFSPYSLIINMLIVPTISLLLLLGVLILLFSGTAAASVLAMPAMLMIFIYELICRLFLSLPFGYLITGRAPIYITFFALAIMAALFLSRGDAFPRRLRRAVYASPIVFLLVCLANEAIPRPLELTMLDVGQGDAMVLRLGGSVVMIDGGGDIRTGVGANKGARVVVPYLKHEGISEVSAVWLSHTDADHSIGIIETILDDDITVRRLYLPATLMGSGDPRQAELMAAMERERGEVIYVSAGDSVSYKSGLRFDVLAPILPPRSDDANENCVVLRMEYNGVTALFTGDIRADTEALLVGRDAKALDVDLLKVAHHGSRYSSSNEFLEAVSPKIAIIGVGNNNYGHPSPEVIARIEDEKTETVILDTKERGAITLTAGKGRLKYGTMSDKVGDFLRR